MEFTEKFKTYTNTVLLRIIDNPDGYQPNAVETAKTMDKNAVMAFSFMC